MSDIEDIIKNLDEQIDCISKIKSEHTDVIKKILDILEIARENKHQMKSQLSGAGSLVINNYS